MWALNRASRCQCTWVWNLPVPRYQKRPYTPQSHQTSRHVVHQRPNKLLLQDLIWCNSGRIVKALQCLLGTVSQAAVLAPLWVSIVVPAKEVCISGETLTDTIKNIAWEHKIRETERTCKIREGLESGGLKPCIWGETCLLVPHKTTNEVWDSTSHHILRQWH